jgi:hypothetical protein
MNPILLRVVMTMFVVLVLAAPVRTGTASPVAQNEAQKIQSVIVAQLAAFADDDADGAFQTATPAVREAFGDSGLFLALVRGAYPMVYRPSSVTFQELEQENGAVFQLVELTDADAKSWFALFALEQQPDSSWRISGCLVRKNRWQWV